MYHTLFDMVLSGYALLLAVFRSRPHSLQKVEGMYINQAEPEWQVFVCVCVCVRACVCVHVGVAVCTRVA